MKKAKRIYDIVLLLIWLGFPIVSMLGAVWGSKDAQSGSELLPVIVCAIIDVLWFFFWGTVYGSARYLVFQKEKTVAGTVLAVAGLSVCAIFGIYCLWVTVLRWRL